MIDRRAEGRRRTYLGAQVVFNRRLNIYDCLVRDLSDTGAKLLFANPAMIPDGVEVTFNRGGESRRAEVMWRSKFAVGIRFASQQGASYISLEATRKIRRLETEQSALKARIAELSEA